jgi:hypothetical protein
MSLLDAQGPVPGGEHEPSPGVDSRLKRFLPYTTVALIIAILYVGYTFYSRHEADVQAQAQIDAKQEAARKQTVQAVFGDGEIRFTSFSINTRSLRSGQTAQLCFGVVNATSVKMDPPVEKLKPTYQHCFDISPKKTTTYTITAEDGKGHSKSESLELPVH